VSAAPLAHLDVERRKGFTPLPNECLWDWSRLVSGDAQVLSILYINSELHPPRDPGVPAPKQTRVIPNEELAAFARCTVRAVELGMGDLMARHVVEGKKVGPGRYRYSIPFQTWPELPDRPAAKVVALTVESRPADEEAPEEIKRPRGQIEAIYEHPQIVRPGTRTRKKEFPGAKSASWFQTENEGQIDQEVYPYLCDGVLVIRIKGKEQTNSTGTKGEQPRNQFRNRGSQLPEESTKRYLTTLHELLDDYCLRHHGIIPNDKLLAKIQTALGKATIPQFRKVIQAKIRAGKVIPLPLFINLAGDAAEIAAQKPANTANPETPKNPILPGKEAELADFLRERERRKMSGV